MSYLGVPYRLAYLSKDFVTGLTNIVAMVTKPDGTVVGPFSMTELLGIGFAGIYAFNYPSTVWDPEGEYLVIYLSPSENIRDPDRFTLNMRPQSSTGTNQFFGVTIAVQPVTTQINIQVTEVQPEISTVSNPISVETNVVQPIIEIDENQINIQPGCSE